MSKFLRRSLVIFIINGLRNIVFNFIVISTTFRLICPPAFFGCLSNSGTFTELGTTSFIESTGVTWLQACNNTWILNTCIQLWLTEAEQATPVDSIKDVVPSSVKVPEFDKHQKKAGGHIGRNVVEITINLKTIVRKPLMTKNFLFIICNTNENFFKKQTEVL